MINYIDYQLIISILLSLIISIILILISFLLSIRSNDFEKLSPYECGFEPYGDARLKFDIKFYIVTLLFILFDLEISYLFPLILILKNGYIIGSIFLLILTIGFIFEWSQGALDKI